MYLRKIIVCISKINMFKKLLPNNLKKINWNDIIKTNIYKNWTGSRSTNRDIDMIYIENNFEKLLYKELFEIYMWNEKRLLYIESLNEDKENFYDFFKNQEVYDPKLYYDCFILKYNTFKAELICAEYCDYRLNGNRDSYKIFKYDNINNEIQIVRFSNYIDTARYSYYKIIDIEKIIK